MAQATLKKHYEKKRIDEVRAKAGKIDALISENHQLMLLNEALEENIEEVQAVIEKLRGFEDIIGADPSPKKGELTKILQDQMDDINAAVNKEKGLIDKVFRKYKPQDNPINKALFFIAALEEGFKVLPTIVKNNIKNPDVKKSIDELLGVTKEQPGGAPDKQKEYNNITKGFEKAFVTKGKLAQLKFDPNAEGLSDFIFGLSTLKLETLEKLAGAVGRGPQASKTAEEADVTAPAAGKAGGGKQQLVFLQQAAKDAGISEKDTINKFLVNIMKYDDGEENPNASAAVKVLKLYATKNKVAKGQLDGFVDGIAVNKDEMVDTINKAVEELKKKEEKTGEPAVAPV